MTQVFHFVCMYTLSKLLTRQRMSLLCAVMHSNVFFVLFLRMQPQLLVKNASDDHRAHVLIASNANELQLISRALT